MFLGLGAGFPVLKKTQRVVREKNSPETSRVLLIINKYHTSFLWKYFYIFINMTQYQQEPETKPEDKGDIPKQDEAQKKPKWMPPKHPG